MSTPTDDTRRLREILEELAKAERERLAEAYKLPYSEKGILVSNSYLRALSDVAAALEAAAVTPEGRQESPTD